MSTVPKFQFWPLLDKQINRGIGRSGFIFTASFCVLVCGFGYYFIRPWSVLREEDLRELGYLGFVAIPLAAWFLGGQLAVQLFMSLQVLRWVYNKQMNVSEGTIAWLALGALLVVGGIMAGILIDPFYYGIVASIAGGLIFFRTTGAIWAWRISFGATSFPK